MASPCLSEILVHGFEVSGHVEVHTWSLGLKIQTSRPVTAGASSCSVRTMSTQRWRNAFLTSCRLLKNKHIYIFVYSWKVCACAHLPEIMKLFPWHQRLDGMRAIYAQQHIMRTVHCVIPLLYIYLNLRWLSSTPIGNSINGDENSANQRVDERWASMRKASLILTASIDLSWHRWI